MSVGKLVDASGPRGKTRARVAPTSATGADHGARTAPRGAARPSGRAGPSIVVAHAGVDALVADDRQLAVLDRKVDRGRRSGGRCGACRAPRRRRGALHGIAGAPAQAMRRRGARCGRGSRPTCRARPRAPRRSGSLDWQSCSPWRPSPHQRWHDRSRDRVSADESPAYNSIFLEAGGRACSIR